LFARQGRRIFALKGSSESGKEVLWKFSTVAGGARNEALDLEVYALAALYVLGQATLRKLGGNLPRS
jgi:phage terminase large subunit GpA-like protein